jgi:hypothetical protein
LQQHSSKFRKTQNLARLLLKSPEKEYQIILYYPLDIGAIIAYDFLIIGWGFQLGGNLFGPTIAV